MLKKKRIFDSKWWWSTHGKNLNAFTSKLFLVNASRMSSSVMVALEKYTEEYDDFDWHRRKRTSPSSVHILTECCLNVVWPTVGRCSDNSCFRAFWIDVMDFVRSPLLSRHPVGPLLATELPDACWPSHESVCPKYAICPSDSWLWRKTMNEQNGLTHRIISGLRTKPSLIDCARNNERQIFHLYIINYSVCA